MTASQLKKERTWLVDVLFFSLSIYGKSRKVSMMHLKHLLKIAPYEGE